jgi:thiamine biosynthesis lipoprotein
MRKNQLIMGTGVSLDIPGADDSIFERVFKRLVEIDARYSTYKETSEVSRFRAGKIAERNLSSELKKIFKACKNAEAETDGYFSAWAGGTFNPSGYVKGWAIAEAGKIVKKAGYKTFCIGIGGDILATSNSDKVWKIGIQNPADKSKILNKLSIRNGAVATSGTSARGLHIINPKTGMPADSILSITVAGPDIIDADVLATAAFVQGKFGLNFIGGQAGGYQALMVDKAGQVSMTRGMQALLQDGSTMKT